MRQCLSCSATFADGLSACVACGGQRSFVIAGTAAPKPSGSGRGGLDAFVDDEEFGAGEQAHRAGGPRLAGIGGNFRRDLGAGEQGRAGEQGHHGDGAGGGRRKHGDDGCGHGRRVWAAPGVRQRKHRR